MPIKMPEQKPQGSGLAKMIGLGEAAVGAATGNPLLVASGMGSLASGSPAGKVAGAIGTVGGMADKATAAKTADAPAQPIATDPNDPIGRKIQNYQSDPDYLIHQGLQIADNEQVPLDYETRMAVLEPLLRAKHFGHGGGLT